MNRTVTVKEFVEYEKGFSLIVDSKGDVEVIANFTVWKDNFTTLQEFILSEKNIDLFSSFYEIDEPLIIDNFKFYLSSVQKMRMKLQSLKLTL